MLRALLSIAFFAGFVIGGGSAFAQTRTEKAQKPEVRQIAQAETAHLAEVKPGDDKAAGEQEVRQEQGAGEAGDEKGGEAELQGRAAEGEQEIENEAEHQHRGRDRDRDRGRDRDRSGSDRGREGDSGGHGGRR
jgi:hypothetical protein